MLNRTLVVAFTLAFSGTAFAETREITVSPTTHVISVECHAIHYVGRNYTGALLTPLKSDFSNPDPWNDSPYRGHLYHITGRCEELNKLVDQLNARQEPVTFTVEDERLVSFPGFDNTQPESPPSGGIVW